MVKTVSDENIQMKMSEMIKSLKQVETDVNNAQAETAESNDEFVPVMTISFPLLDKLCCCRFRVLSDCYIFFQIYSRFSQVRPPTKH